MRIEKVLSSHICLYSYIGARKDVILLGWFNKPGWPDRCKKLKFAIGQSSQEPNAPMNLSQEKCPISEENCHIPDKSRHTKAQEKEYSGNASTTL